jgi:ABC-type phosphate transport system substrate-binding protein
MRILSKLVVGAAAAATAVTLAAPSALADPPAGVTPAPNSVVAVGSDTIQNVFDQFSHDFNATHRTGRKLYSWDATNPKTGLPHDMIKFKRGCSLQQRPNGSSEGITAVGSNLGGRTAGNPCEDLARSSRDRATTDPSFARGGLAFVTLAGDAVTWSTPAVSNAPVRLSPAQLTAIYECNVTNWHQVGGKNAPIKAILPQSGSGTLKFFLKAIGVTTPGACVVTSATLEENEGVNPILHSVNAIYPYSIGKFIAEKFHSAKCLNAGCTPVHGVICRPARGQNLFGCDTHGTYVLHPINRTPPTLGTGKNTRINPRFIANFTRKLFEVVRFATGTRDHIPAYLEPFFGARGWVCTNATAKADLLNYGFVILPTCGQTH